MLATRLSIRSSNASSALETRPLAFCPALAAAGSAAVAALRIRCATARALDSARASAALTAPSSSGTSPRLSCRSWSCKRSTLTSSSRRSCSSSARTSRRLNSAARSAAVGGAAGAPAASACCSAESGEPPTHSPSTVLDTNSCDSAACCRRHGSGGRRTAVTHGPADSATTSTAISRQVMLTEPRRRRRPVLGRAWPRNSRADLHGGVDAHVSGDVGHGQLAAARPRAGAADSASTSGHMAGGVG
eukprot:scaffold25744_cov79-Isochrysis_galbana.AAC.2